MSRFRRFELIEEPFCYSSSPLSLTETLTFPSFIVEDSLALDLDHFLLPSPFDAVTDLVRINRAPSLAYRRVQRVERQLGTELCLQSLCDRVAELESRFDRLLAGKSGGDRKYTWTAEIKGAEKNGFDRKYKWEAEIAEEEKKKKLKGVAKNIKWTAEIKGRGEDSGSARKYTFQVESGDAEKNKKEKEKEKEKEKVKENVKDKKKGNGLRIVEIQEPSGHRDVVLRQAFAKRFGAIQNERGKKKELSPQDAALLIQISFKAYLIRRSKSLRALRELAVAKAKLKEIRAQFNNFSYRRHIARDAEEHQRFSEKIIVVLLTVDAIEGADRMIRSAKRSMVDELEAMLDVVDPQPTVRSLSIKRRTFDMPDGVIRKEIEDGVAQVVQMLDEAENSNSTFEACL
ncbi:BAG family molecular chaperone regulator 7 [Gastrolobium bilobum]|uniref:BAG family molecular chaperone regulator 7 n=1 Tax=Gastrolobium bilobum TaxID=150636 RepID=UPI002AB2D1F1|nr:BAG family molecular chaperone regulator 7 [Gastrolobium bilobum]